MTFHVDPAATVGDLARAIDARLVATLRHGRFRGEDLAREVRAIDPDRRVFGPGINSMMFEHVLEFDGNPARIRGSVTGRCTISTSRSRAARTANRSGSTCVPGRAARGAAAPRGTVGALRVPVPA
ncbi:hypothetical protein GS944_03870 [Rhodococcus hoagii]|nr:hypothetical protein [Prescottella equi]